MPFAFLCTVCVCVFIVLLHIFGKKLIRAYVLFVITMPNQNKVFYVYVYVDMLFQQVVIFSQIM